jgi:transcriptional regulator with XRE-family HTH domain
VKVKDAWRDLVRRQPALAELVCSDPTASEGWQVYTLADAYKPRPKLRYVVDGLFPLPSLSIVYGAPGTLKSLLMADMAVSVAAGAPWLPLPSAALERGIPTLPVAVLWCDFDNGPRITHERFEALGRARHLAETVPLSYVSMPSPWLDAHNTTAIAVLAQCMHELGTLLVCLDNLTVVRGKAEENSAEMGSVMANFRRLAEDTGAAVILIHHQRKNTQGGKGQDMTARAGDRLRGHSSIEAAIDLALLVEREPQSSILDLQSTKTRGVDALPFRAQFTYEYKTGTTELATARFFGFEHAWRLNLARRHLSREQKQAIAFNLRREGWTQERIAQALSVSQATISMWLIEFTNSDKLPTTNRLEGKDGKRYPARKPRQPSTSKIVEAGKAEEVVRTAGAPLQQPASSEESSPVREVTLTRPAAERQHAAMTADQWLATAQEGNGRMVVEGTPENHTEIPGPLSVQFGLSARPQAPDTQERCWPTLVGQLYAALCRAEDLQELVIIIRSWNPQRRAECRDRCLYIIGRLHIVEEVLEHEIAGDAPDLQAEGLSHHERSPHAHEAIPSDPIDEQSKEVRTLPEGAPVASVDTLDEIRRGEQEGGVVPSYQGAFLATSAEPRHKGISNEAIDATRQTHLVDGMALPLMPAGHEVADVRERGGETGIGPQGIGGESAHEHLGVDRAPQAIERAQVGEVSDMDVDATEAFVARLETVSDANEQSHAHRQAVMEQVKALRAEQRSFREIAAILNAEGVATFTGQGRRHHWMLSRLLHAIEAEDQTP